MKKIINKNHEILYKEIFIELNNILEKLSHIQTPITMGVSGGTSLNEFYTYITQNADKISKTIWGKLRFVFVDERQVPLDHQDSNYKTIYENLFKYLIENNYISSIQIIQIDISKDNYIDKLNENIKQIDIALIGVGPDGHVCSLFPHHLGLEEEKIGYIHISNSPKPPSDRITISKNLLKKIENVFIFFMGEQKKQAYKMFLSDDVDFKDCPAKLVLEALNLNLISDLE